MDINCLHNCDHQKFGKCTLNELPDSFTNSIVGDFVDCLYYENSRQDLRERF